MKRQGYKRYLDPESKENIPRKTKYRKLICKERERFKMIQDDEIIQSTVNDMDEESTVNGMDVQHVTLNSDSIETINFDVVTADREQNDKMLCGHMEDRNHSFAEGMQTVADPQAETSINLSDIYDNVDNDSIYDSTSECNDILLKKHLCACKNATCAEAILMCLKLGIRHSLDWCTITDCLNMINILSQCKVVPSTKFKLFNMFNDDSTNLKYHLYCKKCKRYIGEFSNTCVDYECVCGEKVGKLERKSYFVILDLKMQLRNLLKNPHIIEVLQYRFYREKNNVNALEDIYDGSMYKEMFQLSGEQQNFWNLSYMFNLDGCQAANSSKKTIWPIYIIINELPPHLRFRNMLLVGLWADNYEPHMNIFLQPFIKLANELSTVGLILRLPNNGVTNVKLFPICCCVDSVARAAILNMKQFNGRYGCTFCEHPTERVNNQQKYPMLNFTPCNRTDTSIKKNMIDAHTMNINRTKVQDIKGVWGPSSLMNLKYFDLAKGMVPDYMHSILLGVIRQYTEILLSPQNKNEQFYIGTPAHLDIIDNNIIKIKIPMLITRYPRSIRERNLWKASEWRNWLNSYCLICLQPILPSKYVKHLALLVVAVNICLQKSITLQMIESAQKLFVKFVKLFQKYFGKAEMTYNVHLLLHITSSIRNWGPLWTHNAFPFENENRLLLKLKKSPKDIAVQISKRFILYKLISNFSVYEMSQNVKNFCNTAIENKVNFYCKINNCTLLGRGKEYILTPEEKNCLGYTVHCCKSYKKIIYNNIKYTCYAYAEHLKRNYSIVILKNGSVGKIESICTMVINNSTQITIFVRKFEIDESPFITTKHVNVTHIKKCNITNTCFITCIPEDLEQPCVILQNEHHCYISNVPYGCLRN